MAVAGVLDSAEWQMRFGADGGRVHVDDSGFEIALRAEGIVHVAGVDGGREAVLHVVCDGERVVERLERNHGDDRTENFFLADAHLRIAVDENGWLVEPAVRIAATFEALSTRGEF